MLYLFLNFISKIENLYNKYEMKDGKIFHFDLEIDFETNKTVYGPILVYPLSENITYYFELTVTHHITFLNNLCKELGHFPYWKILESCTNLKS